MAMQKCHTIKDNQNRQITSLCYNQLKHEIVAGLEGKFIIYLKNFQYFLFQEIISTYSWCQISETTV